MVINGKYNFFITNSTNKSIIMLASDDGNYSWGDVVIGVLAIVGLLHRFVIIKNYSK